MKVIIICIVLFALTYNVNGAPAEVENNINDNYLEELLKQSLSAEKDESETAPVAKLDDDEMIEALLTVSLMKEKMNGDDIEGWFKKIGKAVKKGYKKVRRFYGNCNRYTRGACKMAIRYGLGAILGKK